MQLRVTYERRADAAYIYLREIEAGGSKVQCVLDCPELRGEVIVDIDADAMRSSNQPMVRRPDS